MLFNSVEFLIFFPIVFASYYLLPHRVRWMHLLASSYVFYGWWSITFLLLLIASTVIDFFVAIAIGNASPKWKGWILGISLAGNLGLLFSFKYLDFAIWSVVSVWRVFATRFVAEPHFDLVLPVGISFYTFQTLSYTIDVYRGRIEPTRHLGKFALFVAFFPQLVAGPIERATHLLPQLFEKVQFRYHWVVGGLRLMLWGMFKKVFIADRLALLVDPVYTDPVNFPGPMLALATLLFAFQIYCDFSAYSDIAIGAARTLGFSLMKNFSQPYLATSVRDFWRRWHISLSSWFRDYVYLPLGGNRVPPSRHSLNIVTVFLLSGLWHGAAWTFVIWGALHGSIVLAETYAARPSAWIAARTARVRGLLHPVQIVLTFAFVCYAWIFFRANRVEDAFYIAQHVFDPIDWQALEMLQAWWTQFDARLAVVSIAGLMLLEAAHERFGLGEAFGRLPLPLRWLCYYAAVSLMLFYGLFDEQAFIYFQF